jgi:hypothetical protein
MIFLRMVAQSFGGSISRYCSIFHFFTFIFVLSLFMLSFLVRSVLFSPSSMDSSFLALLLDRIAKKYNNFFYHLFFQTNLW